MALGQVLHIEKVCGQSCKVLLANCDLTPKHAYAMLNNYLYSKANSPVYMCISISR